MLAVAKIVIRADQAVRRTVAATGNPGSTHCLQLRGTMNPNDSSLKGMRVETGGFAGCERGVMV